MTVQIVACPSCQVRMKFRGERNEIVCPRCHTQFDVASNLQTAAEPVQQSPPLQQQPLQEMPTTPVAQQPFPQKPVQPNATSPAISPVGTPPALGSWKDPDEVVNGNRRLLMLLAGGGLSLGCLGVIVAAAVVVLATGIFANKGVNNNSQAVPIVAQADPAPVAAPKDQTPTPAPIQPMPVEKSDPVKTEPKPPTTPAKETPKDPESPPSKTNEQPKVPSTDTKDPTPEVKPAPENNNPPTVTPVRRPKTQLRYRWKPGDEHVYKIEITADLEKTINKVSGSCTYKVSDQKVKPPAEEKTGSGTGFVVSSSGYLITCAHVVEDAKKIDVTLGGKKYAAKVIDTNFEQDLALIRIDAENLPVLALADSEKVQLAQEIRAVGFPLSDVLGKNLKVTRGTVAGLVQEEHGKRFQIDASINPGNSGGPVVNERGQVIGIASAKLLGIEVSQVGFAVPSNRANELLKRNGITVKSAGQSEKLSGPDLAKLVKPSVAYLEVNIDSSSKNQYRLSFSGSHSSSITPKDARVIRQPSFPDRTSDRGTLNVSEFGDVNDFTGSEHLPYVLGPIGLFIIEDLDSHGESRWGSETQTQLHLVERTDGFPFGSFGPRIRGPRGPFGSPFGRGSSGSDKKVKKSYPAIKRIRYSLGKDNGNEVVIKKSYEFRTLEDANKPFMLIKGSGEIVFDKQLGMPKSLDYKATFARTEDDKTTSVPFSVTYVLRDPAEIAEERRKLAEAAAKAKAEAEKKKAEAAKLAANPDPKAVGELIDKINAGSTDHRTLEALAKRAVVEERQDEVVELFSKYVGESHFVHLAAVNGIANWSSEKHVPKLLELLENAPRNAAPFTLPNIMKSLGRFKNPDVYQAIAARLGDLRYDGPAKTILIAYGAEAEDAVLDVLKNTPKGRKSAATVLKQIGTEKSIEPLEKAELENGNTFAKREFKAAREEIKKRVGDNLAPRSSPSKTRPPADGSRGAT